MTCFPCCDTRILQEDYSGKLMGVFLLHIRFEVLVGVVCARGGGVSDMLE